MIGPRSSTSGASLKVLVSGVLAGVPSQGGATWAALQYVLGLRQLGHDVWFVEPVEGPSARVVAYFRQVCARFDLGSRAALWVPGTHRTVGPPYSELKEATSGAEVMLNLSGVLREFEPADRIPHRIYVDLDPAFTQLWQEAEGIDMGLEGHTHFVTVGTALGRADCPIPTCGVPWIPTLQPVVLEEWPSAGAVARDAFTTVANWRGYGGIRHDGVRYGQKVHSLREFIELPRRSGERFELALEIDGEERRDLEALDREGWTLVEPTAVAGTPDRYREFVAGSLGEFGIVKEGYRVSRSGWFSDRSACYLASGRPVLAMETGFSRVLPTGVGLFSFETYDEAMAGLEAIRADYGRQSRAAREIAETHFDSRRVLRSLLELRAAPARPRAAEASA